MRSKVELALALVLPLALVLGVYAVAREERSEPRPASAPARALSSPADSPAERGETSGAAQEREALPESAPLQEELGSAEPAPQSLPALEIRVLRGDEPALDARAWLVPGYYRELSIDLESPPPGFHPVFSACDAEGTLRFSELAPGPYRVAIELAELRLEQAVRLVEGRAPAPIVIRLGAATVEGFVFDAQGAPASGALVRLARRGYGRNPAPFECFARTDSNGFYRILRVAPGLQAVEAHPAGTLSDDGSTRECSVPTAGILRVDFGAPALEGALWKGFARNSAGAPVPGPGEIRVHDEERDESHTLALALDGSFELRLRPGRHHVWIQPAGFFPQQVDLGLVDVPAGGLQRDLLLPGARLCLHLTLPSGWDGEPSPTLRAQSEGQSFLRFVPLADGSWVHDGLAPGEYVLSVAPLCFEETRGPEYPFTLPAGQSELVLDVHLEPPR